MMKPWMKVVTIGNPSLTLGLERGLLQLGPPPSSISSTPRQERSSLDTKILNEIMMPDCPRSSQQKDRWAGRQWIWSIFPLPSFQTELTYNTNAQTHTQATKLYPIDFSFSPFLRFDYGLALDACTHISSLAQAAPLGTTFTKALNQQVPTLSPSFYLSVSISSNKILSLFFNMQ